jgi:hypothetical protein
MRRFLVKHLSRIPTHLTKHSSGGPVCRNYGGGWQVDRLKHELRAWRVRATKFLARPTLEGLS